MSRCARSMTISTVAVTAGTPALLLIPRDTVAFALQVRTTVGATVREGSKTNPDYFSLAAGATLSSPEFLGLANDLELWIDAASGSVVVEVWLWSA